VPNGTQSGLQYTLVGKIYGELSNEKAFSPKTIYNTSMANPRINITTDGFYVNPHLDIFFPLHYHNIVNYTVTLTNPYVSSQNNV